MQESVNNSAKGPNKMAERIALVRAGEARRPEGERVCDDQYAKYFVGPELGKLLALDMRDYDAVVAQIEQGMPGMTNSTIARARFFDDTIKQVLAEGIEQFVILGAGYDTRAYRIAGMDKVRVFEVDQLETIAAKTAKIREIFGSLPGHVTYVPIDFNVEKLETRLRECGYDPSKKTLFTLEGLIMYLDYRAVDALFSFMAHDSGKGSAVVFDYGRVVDPEKWQSERNGSSAVSRFTKSQGDVLKFAIIGTVEAFLEVRGFTDIRDLDSEAYKKAYFHGNNAGRQVNDLMRFAYARIR